MCSPWSAPGERARSSRNDTPWKQARAGMADGAVGQDPAHHGPDPLNRAKEQNEVEQNQHMGYAVIKIQEIMDSAEVTD